LLTLTLSYAQPKSRSSAKPNPKEGTALIRPDLPELLTWPYLWQQTEYVLGGGIMDFLFLVLAADKLLNQ